LKRRRQPSVVDRFLRLFTDVKAGESKTVLLLALNVFMLLMAYYFIKPVREALILEGGGAEWKAYTAAAQAVLLLGAVRVYGSLASRYPRRRLINVVTTFFAASFGVFFLIAQVSISDFVLGVSFFLWVGIFNLMIVTQFWSFANDIYTRPEGERLFPIVAFGASAGAVAGSFVSGGIIDLAGSYMPILMAAAVLMLSLLITNYVDRIEERRVREERPDSLDTSSNPATSSSLSVAEVKRAIEEREEQESRESEGAVAVKEEEEAAEEPIEMETGMGPFKLVFKVRYLLLIALLILFLNWVNTTGEYILGRVVVDAGAAATGGTEGEAFRQFTGTFYSSFYGVVNALALFIQLFLVSRIIKYLGMRVALLVLPVISLASYTLIFLFPLLTVVRWAKTAENAIDYSLQNTVRQALFLPCTREQKYKAKQATDSFFWRAGDVLSAVVVFIGTVLISLPTRGFAAFNFVLVLIWFTLALMIGRHYKQLVESGHPPS
jgi:AAA family ATP:ADP antiporter